MNLIEKFLNALEATMKVPQSYGWFHILFIILTIATTVLFCVFFKDCNEKTFNRIVLICWIIFVILEVYKQVILSFHIIDGEVKWYYEWWAFPFQLCSSPHYVLPFVFLLKNGKIRDAFISYVMTFAFFGGLVVYIYPNDVFTDIIGINFQTSIHHGLQIVLGIFFMVHNRKRVNFKFFLPSTIVFSALTLIAMLLNIGVYKYLESSNQMQTFNMFFISPYFNCTLPLLSLIYPNVPYIIFLFIYILGFAFVAYLMYLIQIGIYKLVGKISHDRKQKVTN